MCTAGKLLAPQRKAGSILLLPIIAHFAAPMPAHKGGSRFYARGLNIRRYRGREEGSVRSWVRVDDSLA